MKNYTIHWDKLVVRVALIITLLVAILADIQINNLPY